MHCQNCGTENEEGFKFCMRCGAQLPTNPPPPSVQARAELSSPPISPSNSVPPSQPSQQTAQPTPPQAQAPSYPPQPVSYQRQESQPAVAGAGGYGGAMPPQYRQLAPNSGYPEQPSVYDQRPLPSFAPQNQSGQQDLNLSTLHIWGPFAGFGTRRRHVGWLMDNKGESSQKLVEKVNSKFMERQIPETDFRRQVLEAKGVLVERRPYFIVQHNLVSTGLNITSFGRDLFISIASYLKPPISNFRVLLLGVMVFFGLYMTFGYPESLSNAANGFTSSLGGLLGSRTSSGSGFFTLLCVIGPLGFINNLALFLFLIYSGWKWMTEKDALAGLRTQPNEFNEDDLMALEKAVEQTVRQSMDEIGLNPADLKPIDVFEKRQII